MGLEFSAMAGRRMEGWFDGAALCASSLCTLHCLALPLLLAALPALFGPFVQDERFHLLVLVFAIPTSGYALVAGWRRHRMIAPSMIGAFGLASMGLGIGVANHGAWETTFTVAGSAMIAVAHVINWRSRRRWVARRATS